jgi:hypothetical protein
MCVPLTAVDLVLGDAGAVLPAVAHPRLGDALPRGVAQELVLVARQRRRRLQETVDAALKKTCVEKMATLFLQWMSEVDAVKASLHECV